MSRPVYPKSASGVVAELTRRIEDLERTAQLPHASVTIADGTTLDVFNELLRVGTVEQQAQFAQATANGKNKVTYSDVDPTALTPGTTEGDLWFRMVLGGGFVAAQWRWDGTAWQSVIITEAVIGNLDAGKITTGEISTARLQVGAFTESLIPNGDFELLDPTSGLPIHWNTTDVSGSHVGQTFASETGSFVSGARALRMTIGPSGTRCRTYTQSLIPIPGGATLALQTQITGNTTNVQVGFFWYDAAGTNIGSSASALAAPSGSFTEFTHLGVAPAAARYFRAQVVGIGVAGNSIVVDAATVRRAMGSAQITDLTVAKLTTGWLTGATILAGSSANNSSRVEIDSAGIRLIFKNASGVDTTRVNLSTATGQGTFTGAITSGSTITGAEFSTGTTGSRINLGPSIVQQNGVAIEFVGSDGSVTYAYNNSGGTMRFLSGYDNIGVSGISMRRDGIIEFDSWATNGDGRNAHFVMHPTNGLRVFSKESTLSQHVQIQHSGDNGNAHVDVFGVNSNGSSSRQFYLNWFSGQNLRVGNGTSGGYSPVFASAFTVSSRRDTKKNIQTLPPELARVMQLRPVSFQRADKVVHDAERDKTRMSFVAEEVAELFPEVVYREDNGDIIGIDLGAMVPILTKAIQELAARPSTVAPTTTLR